MASGLQVRLHQGSSAHLDVIGDVDLVSAHALQAALDEASAARPGGEVVVDLRQAGFVGAQGLGILCSADARLRDSGGWLKLQAASAHLRRVLESIGQGDLANVTAPLASTIL